MPRFDTTPFNIAASLALRAIEERPSTDDAAAAHAAWQVLRAQDAASFAAAAYENEVLHGMNEIRAGRWDAVAPSLAQVEQAIELLDSKG